MFGLFQRPDVHLKRVTELLRDAHVNRVEHQAAAEHHSALARMYAERAERLEVELRGALPELLPTPAQHSGEANGEIDNQAKGAARPRPVLAVGVVAMSNGAAGAPGLQIASPPVP